MHIMGIDLLPSCTSLPHQNFCRTLMEICRTLIREICETLMEIRKYLINITYRY